ncbi:MAG: O-antigen ligase family protein [Nitrospira sp.]|nr:O-antigen ligase family protein [Nitrospira sp.]
MPKQDTMDSPAPLDSVVGRAETNRLNLIDVARGSAILAVVGLLYSPTVASIGLVATYIAFLASGEALARLKGVASYPPVYWGLAFLGLVIVGMTYGPASWQERWTDVLKWRTVLWFIILFALFDSELWKRRLLYAFLIGAAIGVTASFASLLSGISLWKSPEALLRNNVTQAMSFAIATLLCLWLAWNHQWQGRTQWLLVLATLFAGNVLFISGSRSGYVALFAGVAVWGIWSVTRKQRRTLGLAMPIVAAVIIVLSPPMQQRVTQAVQEWNSADQAVNETSMGARKVFLVHTLEIAAHHWVMGVGTGGFKRAYAAQIAGKYDQNDWRSQVTGDPHNQYLAIVVQHGLPGLLVFVLWLGALVAAPAGPYRGLAMAILCGWCLTSLFSSHFRTFAEGHLVTTFLGVLLAPELRYQDGHPLATLSSGRMGETL